jgi:hypothetical protein
MVKYDLPSQDNFMSEQYTFEPRTIQTKQGRKRLPLLVDSQHQPTENSLYLWEIAETVDTHLKDMPLPQLIDRVGGLLADGTTQPDLLLEDEEVGRSVKISRDETQIRALQRGIGRVPTAVVFDMLYAWNKFMPPEGQQAISPPEVA